MAPTTRPRQTKYSEQNVLNASYDEAFDVVAFELLAYDSVSDTLRRVTNDALNHYGTNNIDTTDGTVTYEGLEDSDGNWQVVKISVSGAITTNRFATLKNNPAVTNYADAWSARASTLVYDTYSVAF